MYVFSVGDELWHNAHVNSEESETRGVIPGVCFCSHFQLLRPTEIANDHLVVF